MPSVSVQVSVADLRTRLIHRLLNGAPQGAASVVWVDGGAELLIHVSTLAVRLTGGWLVVDLQAQTAETGTSPLRAVFFLGQEGQADGLTAAGKLAPGAPAVLADRWGEILLTALWNAVLDVLQGAVQATSAAFQGYSLTLAGYSAAEDSLRVSVHARL